MCGFCNVWVCVCVGFVMFVCVYVWVCVCVGFVMFVCVYVWVCVCVGVLVISVLVFTVVLYYLYCAFLLFCLCRFILAALLPPNENSVAVNNNKNRVWFCVFSNTLKSI